MDYPLTQVAFHLFPRPSFEAHEMALWQSIELPAPPSNESELEEIRQIQQHATAADHDATIDEQWGRGISPQFELAAPLADEAVRFISPYILHAKLQFGRRRPHTYGIQPTILTPDHPAYPSGHATQAHALAKVASCLHPARSDEFKRMADAIALHRVQAGVHYPSDSVAGELLADQLACATLQHLHDRDFIPAWCLCQQE
jgi:hypothetical protein